MGAEGQYRPEIDGLRAVAVAPVILYHAGFAGFGGGFLGVDVFFVISGYLITRLVDAEIRQGEFSLLRFYERRVRRILPALYLVVIVSSIFAWLWMLPLEISDFERSVVAVALFGSNVFFNWEIGYFTSDIELWPLIHTWSLAVEEQFYAVFPLVLILLRRGRPKWAFAGIAALSAVSLAWAQWASQVDPQADFYLPQFRAWELGAGALVALAAPGPKVGARLRSGLAGLGAALLLFSFVFTPRDLTPSLWSLAPVGGSALLIAFATPDNAWGKLLAARPFVAVGLISYSAYLWHQPLFAFARLRFDAQPASWTMLLLSVATFAIAYGSWRFVEQPFRSRRRFSRTFVFASALAVGLAAIASGRIIVIERGFPQRFPPIDGALNFGAFKNCLGFDDLTLASIAEKRSCRIGVQDGAPDFLLIGDSHAAALADGVDAAARRAGRTGFVVGTGVCMPILGLAPKMLRFREGCRRLHAQFLDIVDKLHPKLVLMHAAWEPMEGGTVIEDDAGAPIADSEDIRKRLLATLSARGVRVVIITSTPLLRVKVPEFLARKAWFGFTADPRLTLDQFLFRNRTAFRLFSDPEVRRYATEIDLYPFFCGATPDSRCELADARHPFYYDAGHLSAYASVALSPLLEQAFK